MGSVHLLQEEIVGCRKCSDSSLLLRANPIRPSDYLGQGILLIGQAPGPVTDRMGYHFAGPAGRVLDQWFQRAGLEPGEWREVMYLSSLTRCFPGKSSSGNGDRPPSRKEMALCRPFLDREIQLIDPTVIVLVGGMAIEAFLGKMPLVACVGQLFERDGRQLLPLPHASGVSRWLNLPSNRELVDQALALLAPLLLEARATRRTGG